MVFLMVLIVCLYSLFLPLCYHCTFLFHWSCHHVIIYFKMSINQIIVFKYISFFFYTCWWDCGYCLCTVQWLFYFQPIIAHRALFIDPQISFFSNFFIKNGSHGTIYTFKNYFATVFFGFKFSAIFKQTNFSHVFSSLRHQFCSSSQEPLLAILYTLLKK